MRRSFGSGFRRLQTWWILLIKRVDLTSFATAKITCEWNFKEKELQLRIQKKSKPAAKQKLQNQEEEVLRILINYVLYMK